MSMTLALFLTGTDFGTQLARLEQDITPAHSISEKPVILAPEHA
jgi:hypothetical protein